MSVKVESVPLRSGSTADWAASTAPVLAVGELGVDTDTAIIRLGDGTTPFNALPAAGGGTEPLVRYSIECNSPGSTNTAFIFDTAYGPDDGYDTYPGALPSSQIEVPSGRYAASWEIQTEAPDSDRLLSSRLLANGGGVPASDLRSGEVFVPATAARGRIYGTGLILVPESATNFALTSTMTVADTADVTPVPCDTIYALLYLDRLGSL